jgi:hypothetical protein
MGLSGGWPRRKSDSRRLNRVTRTPGTDRDFVLPRSGSALPKTGVTGGGEAASSSSPRTVAGRRQRRCRKIRFLIDLWQRLSLTGGSLLSQSGIQMKPSIVAAVSLAAALSIGTASAQSPIGQAPGGYSPPVYSPPVYSPQAPVWSAPVTGQPAPYIPPPQPSYTPQPVYSAPVTGTVSPYPLRTR